MSKRSVVDWSRHVPLYRNADGTTWYRYIRGAKSDFRQLRRTERELTHLSYDLVGSATYLGASVGPRRVLFVLHDPHGTGYTQARLGLTVLEKEERTIVHMYKGSTSPAGVTRFTEWAFPPPVFAETLEGVIGKSFEEPIQTGTPLLDISAYRLLGLTPLFMPELEFLEWLQGNQNG